MTFFRAPRISGQRLKVKKLLKVFCKNLSQRNCFYHFVDLSVDQDFKKLPAVRYELPAENEEFIKEGLTLIGAPRESLDLCTHRVIHALKTNCNQLNMEETGKLAVMMLNCQLETEGRPTFVCKPEMVRNENIFETSGKLFYFILDFTTMLDGNGLEHASNL